MPFIRRHKNICARCVNSCSLTNCSISSRVTFAPSNRVIISLKNSGLFAANSAQRTSILSRKCAANVAKQFEGNFKLTYNLAPPMLPGVDEQGRPRKRAFGSWMKGMFGILAKFRVLRGTLFDPFSYSEDRKLERNLIKGYEQDVVTAVQLLSPKTVDIAVELLSLPDQIRGYGPVKEASVVKAKARYEQLAKELVNPPPMIAPQIAAE